MSNLTLSEGATAKRDRSGVLQGSGIQGRHVLYAMLGFFGVIFAVNGLFLYFALGSYTGVVADEPYRKGLEYNERIAADVRQTALGWTHKVSVDPGGHVILTLTDRAGAPVAGLGVAGSVGRPSTSAFDKVSKLVEVQPGRYAGNVDALDTGSWLVSIEASRPGSGDTFEIVYRVKERLWLKP